MSEIEKLLDDILRCVVCHCGCYRHHGVDWMPDGSGESLKDAANLVATFEATVRDEALEEAYLIARGQDSEDHFARYGTRQLYWKGRSDAATLIRALRTERKIK